MRAVAVALTLASLATPAIPSARIEPAGQPAPVEELVASMTRREKAAQLVMAPISGRGLRAEDARLLAEHGLGGVILFGANYRDASQLRRLTRAIQDAARSSSTGVRALISADQEGGVVERFPDLAPSFGAPQATSLERAETMGRTTGIDLERVGVNLNLAPVADLDRGPARMMRMRAFGRSAATVRARVAAYLRGILPTGTAAAMKHFPGIGAASRNTDDGRVVIRLSREELNADGTPFLAANERIRVPVMVSNAIYPVYEPGEPASVSAAMYRHLRQRLGVETLAITDALEPIAWRFGGRVARGCPAAIIAGADIALLSGDLATTIECIDRIEDAARDGRLETSRLDAAVTRVLRLKRALGLLP